MSEVLPVVGVYCSKTGAVLIKFLLNGSQDKKVNC